VTTCIDKEVYFIDTMNRTIPAENPTGKFDEIQNIKTILEARINVKNFNKNDVITDIHTNKLILKELIENANKYNAIITGYLSKEFKVIEEQEQITEQFKGNTIYKYKIGENIYTELSSGLQAILRIIIEVIYAVENNCKFIIIEEIDAYLDNSNSMRIIEFLKNTYYNVVFLITTHSADVILKANNFNIFKIDGDKYHYHDSNDMDDLNYINRTLFNSINRVTNDADRILANYMRRIASNGKLEEYELESIKSLNNLTLRQAVLKKYLLGWADES
jgi:ABC-type dipeptide/oligopeptide/nickel transport system ATPase subunit